MTMLFLILSFKRNINICEILTVKTVLRLTDLILFLENGDYYIVLYWITVMFLDLDNSHTKIVQ